MSRNGKNTHKKAAKQVRLRYTPIPPRSITRHARGVSPAFIGGLLVAVLLAGLLIWHSGSAGSTNAASGTGPSIAQAAHPKGWCGLPGQPVCPTGDPDWIPLSSTSLGDIVAAMKKASVFTGIESRYGGVAFDLPVLVHPYHPANPTAGSDYYVDDHLVVSVRDNAGQEMGIFDFVYDRAHQRIRFASYGVLMPRDPRYGHAFPLVASGAAINRVQTTRHVAMLAGATPQLVFFPLASDRQGPESPHPWIGGGTSPMDPLWLVVGTDGHNYFVGSSLQTYTQGDLPIAGV